jgi:hypothetical protein
MFLFSLHSILEQLERSQGVFSISFNKLLSLYLDNAMSYMSCSFSSTEQIVVRRGALFVNFHVYFNRF